MHEACYLRIQIMTLNAVTQGTFWVNVFSQIIFWIVPYAWDINNNNNNYNNNNNNNKKKMNTNCPKCLTVIPTKIHVHVGWNYFPNISRYFAYQLHLSDI